MNTLKLTKLSVTLQFRHDTTLPLFIGNTIRGTLGSALSRTYCKYGCPNCEICDVVSSCAYGSVFKVLDAVSVPNPYCITVPYPSKETYQAGDELIFFITLFGRACTFEEDISNALSMNYLGKLEDTEVVRIERVFSREWNDFGAETLEYCDVLTINFLSPTAIVSGKEILTEPSFSEVIDSLFGRVCAIIDNYCENNFVLPYCLFARKPLVTANYDLRTVRFQTNRQPTDGIVGSIRFFGDVKRYLPYIDLGSQLNIGKKTTRGCGRFTFNI